MLVPVLAHLNLVFLSDLQWVNAIWNNWYFDFSFEN